jgi:putative ABC transport system substrate-binding protein
MAGTNDPVGNGFVASLAHPGGNVTGLTRVPVDSVMMGKGLQMFKELVPNTSHLAILGLDDPTFGLKAAAEKLDVVLLEHDMSGVKSANDFDAILDKLLHERPDAVFVPGNFVNDKYQYVLQEFIWKNRLPSMFEETQWVKPPPVGLPPTRIAATGRWLNIPRVSEGNRLAVSKPKRYLVGFLYRINLTPASCRAHLF